MTGSERPFRSLVALDDRPERAIRSPVAQSDRLKHVDCTFTALALLFTLYSRLILPPPF